VVAKSKAVISINANLKAVYDILSVYITLKYVNIYKYSGFELQL